MTLDERVKQSESVITSETIREAYEESDRFGEYGGRILRALCVSHERLRKQLSDSDARDFEEVKLSILMGRWNPPEVSATDLLTDFPSNPE